MLERGQEDADETHSQSFRSKGSFRAKGVCVSPLDKNRRAFAYFPSGAKRVANTSAEFSLIVRPGWSLAPSTLSPMLSPPFDSLCCCTDKDRHTKI